MRLFSKFTELLTRREFSVRINSTVGECGGEQNPPNVTLPEPVLPLQDVCCTYSSCVYNNCNNFSIILYKARTELTSLAQSLLSVYLILYIKCNGPMLMYLCDK